MSTSIEGTIRPGRREDYDDACRRMAARDTLRTLGLVTLAAIVASCDVGRSPAERSFVDAGDTQFDSGRDASGDPAFGVPDAPVEPRTDLDAGLCVQLQDGGFEPRECAVCSSALIDDDAGCHEDGVTCIYRPTCFAPSDCRCREGRWSCSIQSCP